MRSIAWFGMANYNEQPPMDIKGETSFTFRRTQKQYVGNLSYRVYRNWCRDINPLKFFATKLRGKM